LFDPATQTSPVSEQLITEYSNLTGEIFETVPEDAVLLERNAQLLGPRVTALPGG
jgi:hypothetical protein